jgi:hypothetical protein
MSKPNKVLGWQGTAQVPPLGKQNEGWLVGEKPPSQYFNFVWQMVGEWATWMNSIPFDLDDANSDKFALFGVNKTSVGNIQRTTAIGFDALDGTYNDVIAVGFEASKNTNLPPGSAVFGNSVLDGATILNPSFIVGNDGDVGFIIDWSVLEMQMNVDLVVPSAFEVNFYDPLSNLYRMRTESPAPGVGLWILESAGTAIVFGQAASYFTGPWQFAEQLTLGANGLKILNGVTNDTTWVAVVNGSRISHANGNIFMDILNDRFAFTGAIQFLQNSIQGVYPLGGSTTSLSNPSEGFELRQTFALGKNVYFFEFFSVAGNIFTMKGYEFEWRANSHKFQERSGINIFQADALGILVGSDLRIYQTGFMLAINSQLWYDDIAKTRPWLRVNYATGYAEYATYGAGSYHHWYINDVKAFSMFEDRLESNIAHSFVKKKRNSISLQTLSGTSIDYSTPGCFVDITAGGATQTIEWIVKTLTGDGIEIGDEFLITYKKLTSQILLIGHVGATLPAGFDPATDAIILAQGQTAGNNNRIALDQDSEFGAIVLHCVSTNYSIDGESVRVFTTSTVKNDA